ncbi:MAG: hypothetical protein L0H53_00890, partial [Candidatus Nitrosocosmicus sp.]|nr:hypothetical protein [Candidatus Nitrosocosmicus sp.]
YLLFDLLDYILSFIEHDLNINNLSQFSQMIGHGSICLLGKYDSPSINFSLSSTGIKVSSDLRAYA